jgi:hypothetical protein
MAGYVIECNRRTHTRRVTEFTTPQEAMEYRLKLDGEPWSRHRLRPSKRVRRPSYACSTISTARRSSVTNCCAPTASNSFASNPSRSAT